MKIEQGEGSGERPPPERAIVEEHPRNISGRILDSASGLLRDSISPKSAQHPNTLAQVLCSEGKAGPSSLSASTERSNASEISEGPRQRHGAESWPWNITEGISLDQFMQSTQHGSEVSIWQYSAPAKGKQVATTSDDYHPQHQVADGDNSAVWVSLVHNEPSTVFSVTRDVDRQSENGVHRTAERNAADGIDGADVVKLLQHPNADLWMDIPDEPGPPYTISADDIRIAKEIVRHVDKALASKPDCKSAISAARLGESLNNFSGYLPRKRKIWCYGKGLEHVRIRIDRDDKYVEMAVRRKTIARFDVRQNPRRMEKLVRWLRMYSARHQRGAIQGNGSSGLPSTPTKNPGRPLPITEAENPSSKEEISTLTLP
ncbi:hypothetical protein GJ744_005756 [Endocarpon pusillum]|uniref:Uncharacterized protein n=1 Tax=Endocarpon pusillum TaxID=364733 RepID=A0A8H7E8N9_9EURO|nr:hypothetical protein GJ744_005756 [Endocarpon pusillum]